MIVRFLAAAKRDLDRITAYISRENPATARRVRGTVLSRLQQLADHPESDPVGRVADTRELVAGRYPYILIYRIRGAEIQVLRVLHGARQWPPASGE